MLRTALLAPLVAAWLTPPPVAEDEKPEEKAEQKLEQVRPRTDDFLLQGAATVLDDQCLRLTPDAQWVSGSVWSEKALDLAEPFDLTMHLSFGDRDALGADGIVFVLSPEPRTGWRGEGMGFAGLDRSLGIELDTYQNRRLGDPEADHLALLVNGVAYHRGGEGHIVSLPNLEDGQKHALRVVWSPEADTLAVHLDGIRVATYPGHALRYVFEAESVVHWGLTAGTGRKTNAHDVCFE